MSTKLSIASLIIRYASALLLPWGGNAQQQYKLRAPTCWRMLGAQLPLIAVCDGIGYNDTMDPARLVPQFDVFLSKRGLRLEAVILGGAALTLLSVVKRQTRDCDVLYPDLSAEMLAAARAFAEQQRSAGEKLDDDWLNNGPSSLAELLPRGWYDRIQPAYAGAALHLHALGRPDLLKSKLFALCDRGSDRADCIALSPTAPEIDECVEWLNNQDANPEWPVHVADVLGDLKRKLGHGF